MKRNKERYKKDNKKTLIVILLLIILISAIILIGFKSCNGQLSIGNPKATPIYLDDDGASIEGEAEKADNDAILEELKKQQLVVTDKLSSNISFNTGKMGTIGEWIVENPAENTVVIQAEVYLDETLIAKSTPIYPDQHITAVELLSDIDAGEYEVTAYLNYYDTETKEFISKAGYKIHLTVNS